MKRIVSVFAMTILSLTVLAQSQHGYVKTRGRMVNGQHVHGNPLPGAVVNLYGRTAVGVQNEDGSFSFPVVGNSYTVQSVTKKGYQLVDADAAPKAYAYSNNPLYLVMETPEQQQADQVAAERKLRKTLREQLQKREDEIDAMNATIEEKNRLLAELYERQKNNEQLIADMAKEYAQMDYDQMDELNQRISDAIVNGRLTEADSLLRSKGDMKSRDAEIDRRLQAEAQRKDEITKEQEELAASEAGTRKLLEDYAADCYKYFGVFKLQNQHDSAAYYIEKRSLRDTSNAEWQFDAANYLYGQKQFQKAEPYYKKALEIYRRLSRSNPEAYEPYVALTLNNLANLCSDTQRFSESESMYKEALEIRRRLSKSDPQVYEPDYAMTLNNLAVLYMHTQRFAESEEIYKEALEIRRRLSQSNPEAYERDVAMTLNNLAILYMDTQRLAESEEMYKEALAIRRRLSQLNPDAHEPYVAQTVYNLAIMYQNTHRFVESEEMYKEALEIYRRLSQLNPEAYEPDVAGILHNLANLYSDTQRFTEGEMMYKEALEIYRRLCKSTPEAYGSNVAMANLCLGIVKFTQGLYSEAIPPLNEALEFFRQIANIISEHQQQYEYSLYYLSQSYSATNEYFNAYRINQEWLPLLKEKYEESPADYKNDYAGTLVDQSFCAIFTEQFKEAEQFAKEGLSIDSTRHLIATNLAASLLFQGKYSDAEKIYRQYKSELKNDFLNDFKLFAEAGVIPAEREADVERIKKILSEE